MNIAIIGTGNVGGALATNWSKKEHTISLGVQDVNNFKGQELLKNENTNVFSIHEAITKSEVILIATPPTAIFQILEQMGDVSGKIIIDATNAIMKSPEPYKTVYHALADKTNAEIVKCFNSTGYENMLNPVYNREAIDMFMAGDSEKAKSVAKQYFYTWVPVKWVGARLSFLTWKRSKFVLPIFFLISSGAYWIDFQYHFHLLPELLGLAALLLSLKSFSEKKSPFNALLLVAFNHIFIALAVFFNEKLTWDEMTIYLSGVVVFGLFGFYILYSMHKRNEELNLLRFHGHAYEYPIRSVLFLLACSGLTGFPISPTFLGEDLMFSHIHDDQIILAILVASSFVIDGLALIRIYSMLFLGPHSKTYHEVAYRNS